MTTEPANSHHLEFYFDCSSPWTYLGFERALQLFDESTVIIEWKPILVGGLFNTINPSVYHTRENPVPAKETYQAKDLQDWANFVGIKIGRPSFHPVNSVKAMRGAFYALEENCLVEYARLVFAAYWGDLLDISQDSVLEDIVNQTPLSRETFFEKINSAPYKQKLRDNVDELSNRGGYGSPTMFLDGDDMYFGNDRFELIQAKIKSTKN